jgi:hypothetical protein
MKSWKIAVSLAVIGAVAVPFIVGTWQPRSNAKQWISLTADERTNLTERMERSKNCQVYEDRLDAAEALCPQHRAKIVVAHARL